MKARPALTALAALALVTVASPSPARAEGEPAPGWVSGDRTGFGWEASLGALGAASALRPVRDAGVSAHVGLRFNAHSSVTSGFQEVGREVFFGDSWGAELRTHALRRSPARRPADDDWSLAFGFAPALYNVLGTDTSTSRVRAPSIVGVALPEVGWAYRPDGTSSVYTAHSLSFAFLASEQAAIEASASVWVFYRSDLGRSETMFSVALAGLYRNARSGQLLRPDRGGDPL